MRALNSAVTGLQAQQTAMDVIGNNIANVNTDGFKASTAEFGDLFYQTLQGGTDTVNVQQVGYGAKVEGINKDMSVTGETTTNVPTNLFINGEGYFIVNSDQDSAAVGHLVGQGTYTDYYTRAGDFKSSPDGYLTNTAGQYVMGLHVANGTAPGANSNLYSIQLPVSSGGALTTAPFSVEKSDGSVTTIPAGASNVSVSGLQINADGTLTGTVNYTTTSAGATTTASVTGTFLYDTTAGDKIAVALATFPNAEGLTQVGNTEFGESNSSGTPSLSQAQNGNDTTMISGALEQSNVDLAREFTNMIVTQRGFQANSRVITVADSLLEEIVNLKRS